MMLGMILDQTKLFGPLVLQIGTVGAMPLLGVVIGMVTEVDDPWSLCEQFFYEVIRTLVCVSV